MIEAITPELVKAAAEKAGVELIAESFFEGAPGNTIRCCPLSALVLAEDPGNRSLRGQEGPHGSFDESVAASILGISLDRAAAFVHAFDGYSGKLDDTPEYLRGHEEGAACRAAFIAGD